MANNYPPKDGWIRLTAVLRKPATIEEAARIIHRGFPEQYDIAKLEVTPTRLKAIYRKKPEVSGE